MYITKSKITPNDRTIRFSNSFKDHSLQQYFSYRINLKNKETPLSHICVAHRYSIIFEMKIRFNNKNVKNRFDEFRLKIEVVRNENTVLAKIIVFLVSQYLRFVLFKKTRLAQSETKKKKCA